MKLPLKHSAISLVFHILIVWVLLAFTDLSVYALLIGNVTFPLLICILNCHSVSRHLKFHFDILDLFLKPAIASIGMGIITSAVYHLIYKISSLSVLALLLSIPVAVILYFILIGVLRCFSYEELLELPMGARIARLMSKLGFFHTK